MMWQELAAAVCLVLVMEGLLPFISPRRWRVAVMSVARFSDGQLRVTGLISMVLGAVLLYWVR